jgi:hypothetical protein
VFINYPDDANPFAIGDGAKQAEWFAARFLSGDDATDQCLVLSDANGNINGQSNCDKFGELINSPRNTGLYETMLTIGDRLHDWEPKEVSWDWSLILYALVDDSETERIVQVREKLHAGDIESAMLILTEMRQKRLALATDGLNAPPNE